MHVEQLREHCLSKPEVTETFPFDEQTLVFKVAGKMFCLIGLDNPVSCNLKCDPERSAELRASYSAVIPGWHMNKSLWNTVYFNQDLPDIQILELIDHSYDEVVKKMPKKERLRILGSL